MGAWGTNLLESDSALDVMDNARGRVREELSELADHPITEQHALLASACVGMVAALEPELLDPATNLGVTSRSTRLVSAENTLIRKVLGRFRLPLIRQVPGWKPLLVALVNEPNRRLADFTALAARYRNGELVEPPWTRIDSTTLEQVPAIALSPPRAAAFAQTVFDEVVTELDAEPLLTSLAGALGLLELLSPWVRLPPHRRSTWRELTRRAAASADGFDRDLASSCLEVMRELSAREKTG